MGRIQSNVGLNTGIDIQKTIDQLMTVSSRSRDLVQSRVSGLQSQQLAINELTALVVGVQLQSDRLGIASNVTTTAVSSSKPDIASAAITGKPTPGNYSVQVIQTAQTATSSSTPIASATEPLQAGDFVVRTGGFVDSSASLDDLQGGLGVTRGKIKITDRGGLSREVDLRFATTINDVVQAINNSGLRINARTSGDRLVLNDVSGQSTSNLSVEEVGSGRTAADLGLSGINIASNSATGENLTKISPSTRLSALRDGRGLSFAQGNDLTVNLKDGSTVQINVNSGASSPSSVGQLLSVINAADPTKLEVRIASNGTGFEVIDKTTGGGTLNATGKIADQLGFTGTAATGSSIVGARVQSSLQGPLLSSLKGGAGIGTPGEITITNRNQVTTRVDLRGSGTLQDIVERINSSDSGVKASLNRSRTGLLLQDVTGSTSGNLVVANADSQDTATKLGIAANVSSNTIDSQSLDLQYISEATSVNRLNQGRGIRFGSFTITNSNGSSKSINLTSASTKTVGDVIDQINNNTLGVTAKLNENGDGILLVDTSGGPGNLIISDEGSGNAALDLGIRGSGTTVGSEKQINGRQTIQFTLNGSETVTDLVTKINNANGPLTASLLTAGNNSVRLLLTSRASGEAGRIFAEGAGVGLNISSTGTGRDAVVSVGGSTDSGGTLVRSSGNIIQDAIAGVALTAKDASSTPFEVNVSTNNSTLERNLQLFVDQYNKVRDKIKKETAFNADTKTTGVLIGSGEVLRVEQALSQLITRRTFSSGRIQSLQQLGVSFDDTGKLSLDKEKLAAVATTNETDVKDFLTKPTTGLGARAKVVLETLVGVNNSSLVNRTKSLQRQIDLNNSRVANMNLRLDRERTRLEKQFFDLEVTIGKIRNNGTGLNQLQIITNKS